MNGDCGSLPHDIAIHIAMHKLGRGHRDKVQQFMAITGASEKVALQALKASDWHLEGAFDLFYSQPQVRSVTDSRHLEEFYQRYRDPYVDMIMADGISLLCNDLQVLDLTESSSLLVQSQNL
ncbi:hypothetical protein AMTR_s00022p00249420 [Amborella trichopoda]|uniref:Uncharacterized protein n=1 Tax=Amborella trichopoda TaxID=13333 RepID=W1PWN7_AMBTC|nr:hypothetical protein AMTR_s00022p00249420 [Amborella trichopoda]